MKESKRTQLVALGGFLAAFAVVVVVVIVSGVGGKDSTSIGPDCGDDSSISTDTSTAPEIEAPDDPAPTDLECTDIVVGDGATAEQGDQLTLQYVGANYEDGKVFDSSWKNGQPLPVTLGAGGVIPGFDQGLEGMKVGGRRELILPPDLGYGSQGSPPTIKPNETLIFVVDLLSVDSKSG